MLSRYSHSSLGTWRTCPRKFKFNYIERVKVPDRVTPDAYLGSSVHRVLSKLYSLGADGIVIPLEDVMQMYNEEWKKVDLNAIALIKDFYTVDDYIRLGREMITRHYKKYSPFKIGTLLGTELKLTFDIPNSPFKGNAIIDKLLKLDDGTIQIIDYKTGKNIPKVTDPAFRYQMGFYQIAVQQNFPQYKNIEQVQIYLRPDETITHKISEDELDLISYEFRNQIVETIEAEKIDNFPTKESNLCDYCDYFQLCPAKRHQLLLETGNQDDSDDLSIEQKGLQLANKYLEIYDKYNKYKNELDALKNEAKEYARENDLSKIIGDRGELNIRIAEDIKFISKSKDSNAFANLSELARKYNLEDYFELDVRALMKDKYKKQQFSSEQMEEFGKYVVSQESSTVRVKFKKEIDEKEL
ncbi:MAG: hypothetical protein DRP35_00965 [Candidatus Zixiibacteriota bacterium]|nr:MAG: hypothetical protein DRP35_00965 [candidate division Zixibacteria bacterium]